MMFSTVLNTLTTIFFLTIGAMLLGRKMRSEYRLPTTMFGLWWIVLGALKSMEVISRVLLNDYGISYFNVPFEFVKWSLMPFALFALGYYTIFLFSGKTKWSIPLALLYLAVGVFLIYLMATSGPYVILEETTIGKTTYLPGDVAYQIKTPLYMGLMILAALIFPQLVICIALFYLYFKLDRPTQKYRILLIASSIFFWLGSSFVMSAFGTATKSTALVVQHLIELLAAVMIYLAYMPPQFIKTRYGVKSISDEGNGSSVKPNETGGGD